MTRVDVISQYAGTVSFALSATSPRNLWLTKGSFTGNNAPSGELFWAWDYLEVDNRGNKGCTVFWTVNGSTATATLQSTFTTSPGASAAAFQGAALRPPNFRLPPDSIDRVYGRFTQISALAQGNATTIYLVVGKY